MQRSDVISLVAAVLSFLGIAVGAIVSGRANARTARNSESATNLNWVKQAREDAERAEVARDKVEEAAAGMADWIWKIVEAAHSDEANIADLRRLINGGPQGVHRYRRK